MDVHNQINSEITITDIYCDRGHRGAKLENVNVHIPHPPNKNDNEYQRRKKQKHFRNRAVVEPIFSHLKKDFRKKALLKHIKYK